MRILIVKTSSLGDLIHVFPALDELRRRYPNATIDWVAEEPFAPLLLAHPQIDTVLSINTKLWRRGHSLSGLLAFIRRLRAHSYDLLFDFQGNTKSGIVTFFARAQTKIGFGRATATEFPNVLFSSVQINPNPTLNIRRQYLSLVRDFFKDEPPPITQSKVLLRISLKTQEWLQTLLRHPILAQKRKILVANGSQWKNKQTPLEVLLPFLKTLSQESPTSFLLVWGTEEERKRAEAIRETFPDQAIVLEKLELPTLQNLMGMMDLVIAMDSLPLHLAGTTSVPVFGIFGASSAHIYLPEGAYQRFFQGPCPYGQTFTKRCPRLRTCPTGACMSALPPNALVRDDT